MNVHLSFFGRFFYVILIHYLTQRSDQFLVVPQTLASNLQNDCDIFHRFLDSSFLKIHDFRQSLAKLDKKPYELSLSFTLSHNKL